MSDDELRDALGRAADVVPERDLSGTAWASGRSRRRRTSRAWWGAGAAAAAAVLVGAIAWDGDALFLPDSDPAGTAMDDTAQTTTAGPMPDTDEPAMSGQPTMLTFTSEKGELQNSGVLEQWVPEGAPATTWHLTDDLMWMVEPEKAEQYDPGITLILDQGTWSVRGCGLAMEAPGTVTDGRVTITGDWDVDPDPDPGIACVWHDWLDPERWESLLGGAPLVAQDGTTLLLSGSIGAEPALDRVAVGFARSGVTDPQVASPRAATWEDLAQDWVEAPVADLSAQIPGPAFVDTEPGPEADVQLTSPEIGQVNVTGCGGRGFLQSWLLDAGDTAYFLDPIEFFTADLCVGPGQRQQGLVLGMLPDGAALSVHGDYLVIEGWVDPAVLDPQPTVEDARPALLSPPTQLLDLNELTRAQTPLPEVLEVPTDGIPTLAEDPTDRFVAAVVSEDHDDALLVLGPDQRWRTAATDVGGVSKDGLLMLMPSILDTSISPRGDRLAYRTDASIVVVTASTGEVVEHEIDGSLNDFPDDFFWLDDDRVAVDLREDRAMVIDTSTGEVTHDASWSQLREIMPWRIAVQGPEGAPSGPVVLQRLDAAGDLVEETPLDFTGRTEERPALAQDRAAAVITTEDPAVIQPEGWQGEVLASVSLVLAKDGTVTQLNVLQAESDTVAPVRWVDRGTLIVRVAGEGSVHYVLWDTMNGGTRLLTRVDPSASGSGPVFGAVLP